MVVNANTEIRKLRPAELYNLGLIINLSDNWKKLMASITKDGSDDVPKFSSEHISVIEQAARFERKLAALIFLEEWGTMGKKRPTVGLLLDLLMKTELFRAADYLAQNIMKVATPQRPATGPAAPVDINAIADLLLHQNLESESASNDSDFCLNTTTEICQSQINYPMGVFESKASTNDDNLPDDDDDIGVIEMHYAESRSNQVLEPARDFVKPKSSKSIKEISDLMKFSATDSQVLKEYSRSDMIKFDSEKNHQSERIELCEAIIPDLNLLCSDLLSKHDSSVNAHYVVAPNAEMASSELPACLGRFGASDKSAASVDEIIDRDYFYPHRELLSAELPLCINNRISVKSDEANLNVKFRSDDDDSFLDNSSNLSTESLADRSSLSFEIAIQENVGSMPEIPYFIAEAERRRKTEEKQEQAVEYEPRRNALNSDEIPITVLEFNKR